MSDYLSLNGFVNLAQTSLGAEVLTATDDFFAEKENLLKSSEPVFIEGKYTDRGKWMDGWESRRKRDAGHDHCIVRICRGQIKIIDINTAHFSGNQPESASLEACDSPVDPGPTTRWQEIAPVKPMLADSSNIIKLEDDKYWTHLRLNIYPDGGVARLRVYGVVARDWTLVKPDEIVDLAAIENGGAALTCSDMHFSNMWNLIRPGRAVNMGDGWETARRRGLGHDWVILKLGHLGQVKEIEVDTLHYKGNFPNSCSISAINSPNSSIDSLLEPSAEWRTLLPDSRLTADNNHKFIDDLNNVGTVSHVRLEIYPDGGVGRLRIKGYING